MTLYLIVSISVIAVAIVAVVKEFNKLRRSK